jgi:UDP-N-acetylglucosamine 2-epimerase (non-hydrolysing)
VCLTEPLGYSDFCRALATARLVISDSGGVQEEAPSVGTPALVTRTTTERPEAVEAGSAILVGSDTTRIVELATRLLTNDEAHRAMVIARNPFGDGHAAERIVNVIQRFLAGDDAAPE